MTATKASDIVGKVVDLLTPLSSEDRGRVISASMMLLGETALPVSGVDPKTPSGDGEGVTLSTKAKTWRNQNSLSDDEISQFFHSADGKCDVIVGSMPGKNKKEQTLNAYVLAGAAQLLAVGEAKFTDKEARSLCVNSGCYDQANHSSTLKVKGNLFTGTKDKGWALTAPGLKHAALLIKNHPAK